MNASIAPSLRTAGWLFLTGSFLLFVPYTLLTVTFEYPDILRQDTGFVLTKFREGGSSLIFTWLAFALVGLPLIPAYILLGQWLEKKAPFVRWATSIGVAGLIVQMIGLLRWVFVAPVLSDIYATGSETAKETAITGFRIVHQFGGVLLGEHLGQLFTIIWTVAICLVFWKTGLFSKRLAVFGWVASSIYLLAQAELLATVLPGFPAWEPAGFLGSTLWLMWVVAVGIGLLRKKL